MKQGKFSRRKFLAAVLVGAPVAVAADAKWLEPNWLKVKRVRLGQGKAAHRFVHLTDIHHKGDRAYFENVVRRVNGLSPEFVCFTGDLIEHSEFLGEALGILAAIKSPVYGVPGNHDYWSRAPFGKFAQGLAGTGGAWLLDQRVVTQDGRITIIGATCLNSKRPAIAPNPAGLNIHLMHYPAWVEQLRGVKYDLILAGHSHGGQVRIPFYGAVHVPFGVGRYEVGLFRTDAGPLYVNPGLGWFPWPIRFNCRPEITVFEV